MATQARVVLKIPARIVGAGNITVTLENGIYVVSSSPHDESIQINSQTGTTYTITEDDEGKLVTFDNSDSIIVTIPAGLGRGFNFRAVQLGTGSVTFVGGGGTTVNALGGVNTLAGQYAVGWLGAYDEDAFVLDIGGGEVTAPSANVYERTTSFEGTGAMVAMGPLSATLTTSAGIYDSNDKLVRVLWSAVVGHPDRNDPEGAWDGRLQDATVAPTGTYTAKVVASDCTYTWEGVIGNTSPDHLNNLDYHQYSTIITDMAITAAGEMYFCHGYDERWNTMHVTTTSNIQEAQYVLEIASRRSYGPHLSNCTDGTNVYWHKYAGTQTYVWASACADFDIPNNPGVKQQVHFPTFGVAEPGGQAWQTDTAIGMASNQYIYDIAVQKTGDFLFISRIEVDSPRSYGIWALNKTTGQVMTHNASLGLTMLDRGISTNPVTGDLWVIHSTGGTICDKITKFTVSAGGVLTATATVITGLSDALDLEISPDGNYLLVTDGGTSWQIKAFNTSDGSPRTTWATSGVLGTAGGYATDPTVTNTKFMFYNRGDAFGVIGGGWIAFAADSSFWVADAGNYRYMHFSSGNSPTFIEYFGNIPAFYACHVCRGDPTRVFSNYLEWSINYNTAFGIGNGSWTLAKNWAYTIADDAEHPFDHYRSLKWVGIYSNGRTYAFIRSNILGWQVVELTTSGLRYTTKQISFEGNAYCDANMDLWYVTVNLGGASGDEIWLRKNPFIGFDVSNDPTWEFDSITVGDWPIHLVIPEPPEPFPTIEYQLNHSSGLVEALSNGVVPVFNAHSSLSHAIGDHFGGFRLSDGVAMFSNHPATPENFGSPFLVYPESPYFGRAKLVAGTPGGQGIDDYAGGSAFWMEGHEHVFTQYPGESWGNNQTNVIYHWHETGLLIDRFGPAAPYFADKALRTPNMYLDADTVADVYAPASYPNSTSDFKGMAALAGNAFNGALAFVNDKYYIYENDEWYHGGIHRWKVDGLSTVRVVPHSISWNSASYTPPVANPYDMLGGLPHDTANLPNGSGGWNRTPTTDIGPADPTTGPLCRLWTSATKSDPFASPDLAIQVVFPLVATSHTKAIPRSLTGNWSVDAEVWWRITTPDALLQILDNTGKVIVQLANAFHPVAGQTVLYINGFTLKVTTPVDMVDAWTNYVQGFLPLVISANVSTAKLSVTFGEYTLSDISPMEVGAVIGSPTTFKYFSTGTTTVAGQYTICFRKLMFVEV